MTPYNWKRNEPQVEVLRSDALRIADDLRQGGSAVLMAGRGMGKSVFLRQLQRELEKHDVAVLLFDEPPAALTVNACLEALARRLGVEVPGVQTAREVVDAYRAQGGGPLVLLYDELDRYAEERPDGPPGKQFFNSLESMRRNVADVGVLAAGSIGVFTFRDVLGSSFLARADQIRIDPFDRADMDVLARPFEERGTPLPAPVLDALLLASGGNAALVTYGLGALWQSESPDERKVAQAFARFGQRNQEFLRDFQMGFADPTLSDAPQKAWRLICREPGRVSQKALREAIGSTQGSLRLDNADVLDLLEAAGLVRVDGSAKVDPVLVRPIASLLSLPPAFENDPEITPQQRLIRDLQPLLGNLHVLSADFFRPDPSGKILVPESVFAAFLALGFTSLGWQVEREAQNAAGRTDLKMRWNGGGEIVIIEVKIWGRNDYREAQRQVESYWTQDVVAGAVVQLTDADISDWSDRYSEECLDGAERISTEDSPIRGHFRVLSQVANSMDACVDHLLLRLMKRG